jgi:hypothetical protein
MMAVELMTFQGICGVLRAGIQCVVALIPPLIVAAISPRVVQPDALGNPTHCGLHDSVRGLHGD